MPISFSPSLLAFPIFFPVPIRTIIRIVLVPSSVEVLVYAPTSMLIGLHMLCFLCFIFGNPWPPDVKLRNLTACPVFHCGSYGEGIIYAGFSLAVVQGMFTATHEYFL